MTTKPNEPEGLQERIARELCRQAGYDPDGAARNGWGWRNYMDGAAQIVAIFPAHPVADAGGVAQADRDFRSSVLLFLVDAMERPCADGDMPADRNVQLDALIAQFRLQSVAAATAGMPTIWEDPAGKGYPCFERPMTPAEAKDTIKRMEQEMVRLWEVLSDIKDIARSGSDTDNCLHCDTNVDKVDAALSEAREAGDSLAGGDRI